MNIWLILFLGLAILLWLTSFGYLAVLSFLARTRRRPCFAVKEWPEISVVIPTLNEEEFIGRKFADLKRIDYPSDRLSFLVIDRGSLDQTPAFVQERIDRGEKVRLVCLPEAKQKIEQVIHSLSLLKEDFIVFTDADSRLEPSCIKELIRLLLHDPLTAVAGATVKPVSRLLEEHIHWRFLNHLWWLEGEALSAAGFSGVCYAVRKNSVRPADRDVKADDIHLSLSACASGFRVRICPSAIAYELRVPQTTREFFQYRQRRGSRYVSALLHFKCQTLKPFSWRVVRGIRLWQCTVTPWLGVAFVALDLAFYLTRYWSCAAMALFAFLVPTLGIIPFLNREMGRTFGWKKLVTASVRYPALILTSLLTLNRLPRLEIQPGGSG